MWIIVENFSSQKGDIFFPLPGPYLAGPKTETERGAQISNSVSELCGSEL